MTAGVPMARLVDYLIHRQQRRTQRGPATGGGGDEGEPGQAPGQPLGTGAAAGV